MNDTSGQPLAEAVLQACASVCVVAWSDRDGIYRFDGLQAGNWSIHAAGPDDDSAQLVIPWSITADSLLDIIIPNLGEAKLVPEDTNEVLLAEGLTLSLSTALLPGIAEVRAALMPASLWPPGLGLPATPTVGWSLAPSGAGMALPFMTTDAGRPWCSSDDGTQWEPCDGLLPNLGSIVLVDEG